MAVQRHRVVIVGGGFGGLYAAKALKRAPVDITLIDRRNFHLFQPLLYQVATGALSPANIAAPLRGILSKQRNASIVLGEAVGLDVTRRIVVVSDGGRGASALEYDDAQPELTEIPYDTLIVATGMQNHYFGHEDWEQIAPGLKSIEDATNIRRRVLYAFEAAEHETDPVQQSAWLTFVITGGGPTGVELAGAIAELARDSLRHDFRRIDPVRARIMLVEGGLELLGGYPATLCERAKLALEHLGVEVALNTRVTAISATNVTLSHNQILSTLNTRTVLWTAGVTATSWGALLHTEAGAVLDRQGRVVVSPNLSIPGAPEVMVIGDLAHCTSNSDLPLPGIAPVAMQQGRYAAWRVRAHLQAQNMLNNRGTIKPFHYRHYGSMAEIGRGAAVAELGKLHLWGYPGWLAWLLIHLMYLVEYENRLLVLLQWAWSYFSRNRSARLITGEDYTGALKKQTLLPRSTASVRSDTSSADQTAGKP